MHIIDGRISQIAGTRKRQAMQSGTHFAKTSAFRLHGPACFMLVGALPQSPQNTEFVFWNDGFVLADCVSFASPQAARLSHFTARPLTTKPRLCGVPLPSAARFFKSLMGGQLSAALPLFPVVHSLPPAPGPAPEYGRYWPWPSAALSFPHGLCGSRRRRISSLPAARRTQYSAP